MLDSFLVVREDEADALVPYALSAAMALNAHTTAVFQHRDDDGRDGGAQPAHGRLTAFAQVAEVAGVAAETLYPENAPSREELPRFARAFDFVMVQQREAGRAPARGDLTAALLGESGRPVWVVPAIQHDAARFKRVLVAWDGGATSARAFSEAKRILACAGRVEIVTVAGAMTDSTVIEGGVRLAARLGRAGVASEFRRLASEEDPANALLSYADDVGADLLVCGGYSHSPLRESLFGGVTRTLLTSMTLPTFFGH